MPPARLFLRLAICTVLCATPGVAFAHVSERALVLLLPTDIYIGAGVATVGATVALLALLPARWLRALMTRHAVVPVPVWPGLGRLLALLGAVCLAGGVWIGLTGPRDPLGNGLTLLFWTALWIATPPVVACLGNLWRLWSVPGTGTASWWAVLGLYALALFQVADIAPADPYRIALGLMIYVSAIGLLLATGQGPLVRIEVFTTLFRQMARLSPLAIRDGRLTIGVPGSELIARPLPGLAHAGFVILLLGSGSFDGLRDTFWWLGKLGINPLEFPGRSAVQISNALGLTLGTALLGGVVALATWLGLAATGHRMTRTDFCRFAGALLPIALAYHVAHYLTGFLVDAQYLAAALTDPFATGADYLGLGTFYVTTGFFNTPESVKLIWMTQAGAIVGGHVLAILVAHMIALEITGSHWKAVLSQLPVAAFMVLYTLLGLWLLSTPAA